MEENCEIEKNDGSYIDKINVDRAFDIYICRTEELVCL